MKRSARMVAVAVIATMMLLLGATAAWAGSPHFVGAVTKATDGNTLTVSGKEAGLGGEAQIHIVVTATASCVNPGEHHPKAANKTSVTAQGTFPVQNGKADFSLTATATFKPDCSPPQTVRFSNISVVDTTNGIKLYP